MVKKSLKSDKELSGLGGWLIFPIIGLFFSVFVLANDFLISFETSFDFISLWDLAFLGLTIVCLISLFRKKKIAPKLMVSFYMASIFNGFLIFLLIQDYSEFVRAGIVGLVWISYFNTSVRVKNTFVNN